MQVEKHLEVKENLWKNGERKVSYVKDEQRLKYLFMYIIFHDKILMRAVL